MEKDTLKMGTLYGIGVGPGDEELLTLKAVNVIKKCEVIVAPSAKDGDRSIAFDTAKNFVDENKEVIIKHFPMGGKEQEGKIFEAFKTIEERLNEGKNVAFLTIGDPFVYSTYIYLLDHIKNKGYKTETVPGITSFCAAASLAGQSIVIGDERVLILPASQVDKITDEKFVVIMKVYRKEENVLNVLEEKGFKYICVKRAYREGQEVLKNREDILKSRDYMSLIIAQRD
ncbi:Cobalt-precorrin-2 C(20)-methyltransferase [Clostridium ljungdahlii DSM 13528]|uniref:Cobalt-precorrin-2 C(20)-methyltransferase n=3 Tax=Clostridiaceae TaxID=31979 RepID=D8GQT1_CLOLD|nr:cobalt-precorrin-2 C(20)-methyltransferase [Clostridium ljungdahlii DSM 13528]OAA89895.1 Cobalt-precorrin-2 C(20)-methyltransferase [Clostridium ljungdahlii DSM 13528]OAA94756.1 Cobalt-precorrin-2 C(20)-methyltransferase [Clostridium coskatii]OBR93338.1 cobalt-precorrin-2 C(20)-methyltransferase [Clostridium coskatii]